MIYFVDSTGVVTPKLPRIVDKSKRLSTSGLTGSKPSKPHFAQAGSTEFYSAIEKIERKLGRRLTNREVAVLRDKCRKQPVRKGNGYTRHKQSPVFVTSRHKTNRVQVTGEWSNDRKFKNLKS